MFFGIGFMCICFFSIVANGSVAHRIVGGDFKFEFRYLLIFRLFIAVMDNPLSVGPFINFRENGACNQPYRNK